MLKNEDKTLPHLLKMKNAFWKKLKTEDLKSPVKYVKKMKTASCAGSPKNNTYVKTISSVVVFSFLRLEANQSALFRTHSIFHFYYHFR